MKTSVRLWYYLAEFFLEREVFQTEVVQKVQNTRFMFINFLLENRAVCKIM